MSVFAKLELNRLGSLVLGECKGVPNMNSPKIGLYNQAQVFYETEMEPESVILYHSTSNECVCKVGAQSVRVSGCGGLSRGPRT